ncbi:protein STRICTOSIDINE SYNTHASE-LIKE 3 [Cinnamomum micranthum f. kanehirae]|uniref:Protein STRICTOSIDINE SYNTHASE-LIKE 3 n=1 Tax=Cinnamomum micranthum f. kanehirae TaxID=337451 RepID=A0A3S3N969_9MAGN|nr:protein STRICTOSIDINE SYNTHASE-LIKE 3 [Cinnamomum micranthum f. kanehirae]
MSCVINNRPPLGTQVELRTELAGGAAGALADQSELCDPKPSPLNYMKNEHICGRPLGLRFDKKTGDLYIADAYFGLMKVGPEGGLATSLVTEAEGVPLRFTNDLDIDDEGNIYFTDSSAHYQRRNFMQLVFTAENSGRLLKYESLTQRTTVLLRNLQFPNGVSMSRDGSFFVLSEGSLGRLRRFWLKGDKAGTSDVFALLPGFPDNVRTNEKGEFWVAIHCRKNLYTHILGLYPKPRKFLLKLPIPAKIHSLLRTGGSGRERWEVVDGICSDAICGCLSVGLREIADRMDSSSTGPFLQLAFME